MYWEVFDHIILIPHEVYAGMLFLWFVLVIGTGFYFDRAFKHQC